MVVGAYLFRDGGPRFLLPSGSFHPLPGRAGLMALGEFREFLRVAHGGTQALAAFAGVELQFGAELLEGNDFGGGHLIVSYW
jgi:hypothetical protein